MEVPLALVCLLLRKTPHYPGAHGSLWEWILKLGLNVPCFTQIQFSWGSNMFSFQYDTHFKL